MASETLRETLMWCAVLNYGVLLGWLLCSPSRTTGCTGGTAVWSRLLPECFDTIHYIGV